jgi:3-oxoacyl-[acyl-carrier protein] reductase
MSGKSLEGRVALVTGGSTGLGFAAAKALAERGAKIALNSRGGEKLDKAVARLSADGATVEGFPADISSLEGIEAMVTAARSSLGEIDILVANGGGPPVKPASEIREEDWQKAIPLTLLFVPRLTRLVLPGMKERGWGRIVAINSVSTRQPIAGLALSNVLRPAVVGYIKTLSQEIASAGVTANSVLPGYTRTERQIELAEAMASRTGANADEIFAERARSIPIGRVAEPDEIGAMVGFLCSPEASYVTGQAISVDGGYVLGLL